MVLAETMPQTLITTWLEITDSSQIRPSFVQDQDIEIARMEAPDIAFYRFLYQSVGEKWRWRDRLQLSSSELREILSSDATNVYVLYVSGAPAGYVELFHHGEGNYEIAYFGLREEYMGRGLGKHLLSFGIKQAWEIGASRVFLHTCNLDGPHALANYQKRGFQVFRVDEEPMPDIYT